MGRPGLRVLVTGGAGFIGSAVTRRLALWGHEVVVVDDLSTGRRDAVPSGVEFIQLNITSEGASDVIHGCRPTHVVHCAAQVSVERSMTDPGYDRLANVVGTFNVLDGARRAEVRRFVFLSSGGAVYGECSLASETDMPAPQSYYGIHKLAAEGYTAVSGLSYAIARLANVYGPGQRDDLEGGVVAIFTRAVGRGDSVAIHGDGEQVRDFVHVDDVVRAVAAMLESGRNGMWNVAGGRGVSVNTLLALVEAAAERSVMRRQSSPRQGDVRTSSLAIGTIEQDLGWRPQISLEMGLQSVVAHQDELGPES